MFRVTLKVLIFRYAYTMRQRWLLTMSYLLFRFFMCLLLLYTYERDLTFEEYESHIEEHDERTLLRIPKDENCTSSRETDCLLKIVVCPGGAKERQLMEVVESLLRHPDNTTALEVTYVDDADSLDSQLVRTGASYSRGLHFVEISSTKFEYKIRPRAPSLPTILYDWDGYATTQRFPSPMLRGPRLSDPYFDVNDKVLFVPGLLPLQVAVDKAYVNTYLPHVSKKWILTSFPHPPYKELPMELRQVFSHRFYLICAQYMLMMGITFMILVFASFIISDKMSGIREWMCLNGAIRWMVNSSWLISFCFEATIASILEVVLLKLPTKNGPTISYMSSLVLFFVLIIYNWQSLCWVNLLANVLQSQVLCILITTAYWIFSPIFYLIPPDRFTLQGFLAALPNAGLVLIFKSFQEFDGAQTVLGLNHLYSHPIHYLPVGILLLIMFATLVFLVIAGVYVDLVSPGPYGRAKPWYLFQKKDKTENDAGHDESTVDEKYFEEISSKDRIALECVGISKSFRARKIPWWRFHKAVSNVNMKIPKSKVTVLLGPNGAGKTTLFSMLCGMYSPSAGHFYTDDYDVFEGDNIKKFQKVLGYCPQHNLLMKNLTVRQHLIIFGLLKGLSRSETKESCIDWIDRFEMGKFENTQVKKLSGGTKRKLCLAIAMTGDPLYLLLDEPSAGLDVKSRRAFWNILLEEKRYCTVILTTHDMDEAEILGDRVALLMNGQLVGYGSSSFLKTQLKAGYTLNCTVNEKDRVKFLRSVQNFDRSISVLYETHNTVSLGVPTNKQKVIPNLLKSMESEFGDGISTSISPVTMDHVFVKFHEGSKAGNSQKFTDNLEMKEDYIDRSSSCGQFKEIFKKKFEWLCNKSLVAAIILLLIFPVLGIESAVYFTKRMFGTGDSSVHSADLKLSMDAYRGNMAVLTQKEDDISTSLKGAMKTSGIRYTVVSNNMVDVLDGLAKKDLFEYRSQMVFAFDSGDNNISIAYYSRNAFHTAPIAYSALINAMLQGKSRIIAHNFPFVEDRLRTACIGTDPYIVSFLFLILLGPMLLFSASYFIIFPHIERRTLFKHLQLMTGLLPWIYWISNLMFDMLLFSISILLMIIILLAEDIGLFSNYTVMLAFIIVLILYGASIITFAYACSFFRCSTAMVVIWFISIPPLLLIAYVILLPFIYTLSHIKLLYFLPWALLMGSLRKISIWAAQMRKCYQCKDPIACAFISTQPLILWLKIELIGFAILSLVYFTFILAMDHGFGRKLKAMYDVTCYGPVKLNEDDVSPDVAKEKQRVKDIEIERGEDVPELICDGLGKRYSAKVTAVRDVTFALNRGNIFGLLGANGSGKSTTLAILSGVISPTKGSAIVDGKWDLSDCEYKYIRNIGFCPQFGGLLPGLSGRNTLRLFAYLRGVKLPKLRDSHVDKWLEALDMVSLAERPCDQYSLGNKRKLNFAIAMIGYPTVVLLDEPTAGIDPVVRKRIWDVLIRKDSNQAIVLTSHTLSECEAICDGLTIMVNGNMKCLGSVQELKSNLSKSCTLYIKLQSNITAKQADEIQQNILKGSQISRFAELQEKQINLLKINVKTDKIKIYDVFAEMLKIKDDNAAIENFSLSQTPLEEIFMTYAPSSKKRPLKTPY